MREPVFTETLQVAIVVRDLEPCGSQRRVQRYQVAYLATERALGVITEIFSSTPVAEQKLDTTQQ